MSLCYQGLDMKIILSPEYLDPTVPEAYPEPSVLNTGGAEESANCNQETYHSNTLKPKFQT